MLITAFIEVKERPEGSSVPVRIVGRSGQGVTLSEPLPEGQVYVYTVKRTIQVDEEVLAFTPEHLVEILDRVPQPEWTDISYDDEGSEDPETVEELLVEEDIETPQELPTEVIPLTYDVFEDWAVSVPLVK